jgi:uracil-DNA glycosylase family 4
MGTGAGQDFDPRVAAADLLRWYAEAGVDVALDEEPHDRLTEAAEAPRPRQSADPTPVSTAPSRPMLGAAASAAPADDVAQHARLAARSAASLDELRAILERFDGCSLRTTAKSLVFADGDPAARLMLVGEAPGAEEDRVGLPFVGRSGQLLDRMLAAIGIDRGAAYIANVIPWRPPGNRTPTPQETAICLPFIQRQIELADPDILVCLGGPSAQTLLGEKDGILRLRGRWTQYDTGRRTIRAVATLHPAYLLRQPMQKRLAWRDFKAIRAALGVKDREPSGSQASGGDGRA